MWAHSSSTPCAVRSRTARPQRGSSLVEGALVLLPFMAMTLAIVDFSMPIFLQSLFANAVREGCRFGITHQTTYNGTSYSTQTAAIKAAVQANSLGFLSGTTGAALISVKYYGAASPFGQLTGNGANAAGNILEVSVTGYTWGWIAPIWRTASPLSISASSADRLEPMAGGVALPAP